jgi:hypothetical protein
MLTKPELHQLTGYARPAAQAAWLKEKGIPHRVDGKRVIVLQEHVTAWVEGRQVAVSSSDFNWAAARR